MASELLSKTLHRYLDRLVPPRPAEMQAMEAHARDERFPIIGPAAGHLCYAIARMIGARRIFEMGSGFGYSTAWFARAVRENGGGVVVHVVWDADLSRRARAHLDALGYADLIDYRVGEATAVLRAAADGPYDLIFNDIDKEAYPDSLSVVAGRLRPGGVLIVDNALWYGRIFDQGDRTPETEAVREVTRLLVADPAWITTLVPIRDGLLVAYKR